MRQSIVIAAILAGTLTSGAAMAEMSSAAVCERNAQQVQNYIENHQATLPEDKADSAMEDAKKYEIQCSDQTASASDKLSQLRVDLGMDPLTPQTAQSPDDGE
jgi:hypothetical protein